MPNDNSACTYKILYKGPFMITRYWNNGTFTLQCGTIQIRHYIRQIKPYTYDTNVEDITPENMYDDVNI